jgi:lipopolysaccharide biosynthesis glycosyltransferase
VRPVADGPVSGSASWHSGVLPPGGFDGLKDGRTVAASPARTIERSFNAIATGSRADAPIRVLFCCDPTFYQHLAVALVSMLENNPYYPFEVYLMASRREDSPEAKLRRSLQPYHNCILDIRHYPLDQCRHFFVDQHVSHETYLRLFVDDILEAEVRKILYLDADTVVLDDLWELWTTNIDGYLLAGAHDPWGEFRSAALGIPGGRPYVNAGVLLLNLTRWRAERVTERLIRFIEAEGDRLVFHDQDAINALLYESVLVLDYRWNFQARMFKMNPRRELPQRDLIREAARRPAIIHYNGRQKPWQFLSTVAKKRLYYRYLEKTEWRGARPEGRTARNIPAYCLKHMRSNLGNVYRLLSRLVNQMERPSSKVSEEPCSER